MCFDAEDLPDVDELALGTEDAVWQEKARVALARGGDSTPPVQSNKVSGAAPSRRKLFDESVHSLPPLDLGEPILGIDGGNVAWIVGAAACSRDVRVCGWRQEAERAASQRWCV